MNINACYHYQLTPRLACTATPTHLWRREDGLSEMASCDKNNKQLSVDLANWPLSWSEIAP